MASVNVGQALPLENLGSQITRNQYNYQQILNAMVAWNTTTESEVKVRLTTEAAPFYFDYTIPSKIAMYPEHKLDNTLMESVAAGCFGISGGVPVSAGGGSYIFDYTTFSASSTTITVSNPGLLSVDDQVILDTPLGSTLPQPLSSTRGYRIYTIVGSVVTLLELDGSLVTVTLAGSGTCYMYKLTSTPELNATNRGDIVTIRKTESNSGSGKWDLWASQEAKTWESGSDYNVGDLVIYDATVDGRWHLVVADVTNSTIPPGADNAHFRKYASLFFLGSSYVAGQFVITPDQSIYRVLSDDTNAIQSPVSNPSVYQLQAAGWVSGTTYPKGSYVASQGYLYLATTTITSSTTDPYVVSGNAAATIYATTGSWVNKIYRRVAPQATSPTGTTRWLVPMNIDEILVKNIGTDASTIATDVSIQVSVSPTATSTTPEKNVNLFQSSNLAMWPNDTSAIWDMSSIYAYNGEPTGGMERQYYSASMVFDHASPASKAINYINYDGPDLDRGLCVYFPVESKDELGVVHFPEDGRTFEFFIRIWPNAGLTDAVTRDHVINKAQVYFFDAQTNDAVIAGTCSTPIAKFSMARTTNFYMFGENVCIPDKPVCYRATVAYSESQQSWVLLDYYQLPDHVFVGPVGYLDPQNPGAQDMNPVVGAGNPSPQFVGYETAAFPLFTDPFAMSNLQPYRITDPNADGFSLRLP